MFTTSELIQRIRSKPSIFEGRVGGTLNFSKATGDKTGLGSELPTPHCFVVPLADTAAMPEGNMVAQLVTEQFATIVCVDQAPDARNGPGMNADALIRQARHQLIDAMLFWNPDPRGGPIRYVRGFHLHMTQARIWHQFDWQVQYYVCRTKEVADAADDEWETVFDDLPPIEVIRQMVARQSLDGVPAGETVASDLAWGF